MSWKRCGDLNKSSKAAPSLGEYRCASPSLWMETPKMIDVHLFGHSLAMDSAHVWFGEAIRRDVFIVSDQVHLVRARPIVHEQDFISFLH